MENNDYNTEVSMEDAFHTIPRNEIENEESGYENFLNEIENFFREHFENDILEDGY